MRINVAPPPSAPSSPHRWMSSALGLIPSIALTFSGWAQAFQPTYDLRTPAGAGADAAEVLAYGKAALDSFGRTVRAGDINGDGIDDVIVGATGADVGVPLRTDAGAVLVWFGGEALPGVKDAAGLAGTAPDLTIWGATASDQLSSGGAVAVADCNGDGIDDLVIGALAGDGPANGRNNAGEAYIVFGRTTFPATLDLATQGDGGADVTIHGASADDNMTSGGAVMVADINGDGMADVLLGAPLADGPAEAQLSAGEAYVVLGRGSFPTTLDLAVQGSAGADVTVYGAAASDFLTFGGTMAAGDVNDDGLTDILLGAIGGDGPAETRTSAGEAYVIFGRSTFPATLNLELEGSSGADVTVWGASASDQLTSGGALTTGDIDGDGATDIIVGAVGGDGPGEGRIGAGEAYLIRGRADLPTTLDAGISGSAGADVTFFGATASDNLTSGGGMAVGDINRDGVADLVFSAPLADGPSETRSSAGEAYIVFGGPFSAATLDLGIQDGGGADVTLCGATAGDNLGIGGALTLADVDGNGFADLLLGAPLGDGPAETRLSSGEAFIIRGRPAFPPMLDMAVAGGAGANVTLYGATGSDQITSGGALAAGDVNGDGVADIIIGANNADGPLELRSNAGEVSILFGVGVPEIDVAPPLAADIPDGGSKSLGIVGVDGTKRLVLAIKNTGAADVTGLEITMDGIDADLFAITSHPSAPITPGSSTTFTVAFTPTSLGVKEATIHIANNDEDESPFDITLTGICSPPIPPLVQALVADPVTSFTATLNGVVNGVGSEREVMFEYGTTTDYGTTVMAEPATVDGEFDTPVQAHLTGLVPRTVYHFRVKASGDLGSAASNDMTFETVNRAPLPAPDSFIVLPGGTVTLDVLANDVDPDGDVLQVASFTKPIPANDGKVEQVGNKLVFTASYTFAGATFTYTADDGYGGTATAIVYLIPGFCAIDPPAATVSAAGGVYSIAVTSTGGWSVDEKLSWVEVEPASGVGDGLVLVTVLPHKSNNSRTRIITIGGQEHTITQLGARSIGNAATLASLSVAAETLPSDLIGTYHGAVDRHPVLNANLGSRLDLTTTLTGAFTGKLITGISSQALTGTLAVEPALGVWRAVVPLPSSGSQTPALELVLEFQANALTGSLTDGGLNTAPVAGWRNAWDASANKASAYAASYQFTLEQSNADPATPQGAGYGSFAIDEATGTLFATGRLSDNSVFTSSTFVGQQGQVLLYQSLYSNSGSFGGTLVVTTGAQTSANIIGGTASWYAPSVAETSKNAPHSPGFGLVGLSVIGGADVAPPKKR